MKIEFAILLNHTKKLDIDGNEESSRVIISLTNATSAHLEERERGRGKEKKPPLIVVLCKGTPCAAHMPPTQPSLPNA